jgi:hypothetical protein
MIMKIFPLVVLTLFAIPVHAQSLLSALEQMQSSLPADPGVTVAKTPAGVTAPTIKPSSSNTQCNENKQSSLPLKYLTALILQKDAELSIEAKPAEGTLTISSPAKMIGNCNSMLDWTIAQNEIDGRKTYAVEVKFKDGEACPAEVTDAGDKKCFSMTKIGADTFPVHEMKPFSNDIQGFQKCLEASGVVGPEGKINQAAIFKQPVSQTFNGIEETGKLVFLSHGPVSSQIDPRFGLDRVNGCDVYEKIHPTISMVYSSADLQRQDLEAQADTLSHCQPNEYQRLVDFIERNNYQGNLEDIRDKLILQAAQATAKKIADGKELTDDDMKVIGDFERFIVDPKIQEIAALYNSLDGLEGTELQNAKTALQQKRAELEALGRAPYFQKVQVDKLIAKGMFADAEKMEGIRISIAETAKVGKREGNVTVTPDVARVRVANARAELANRITSARETYDIRTGVTTGMADTYKQLGDAMRRNIQTRTQNYMQEIQSEYTRVQPGGYCYGIFRNTQKCIQDSMARIQELQVALQSYNNTDMKRAAEFDAKAAEYAKLEAEGRKYVAQQNGDEVPREPAADTTVVPPRAAGVQPTMMPATMMNPMQPYGMQTMMGMQQNPYASMYGQSGGMMGQAGFNANFGFQGTMGQNYMGMQQPQYGAVGMNWLQMGQQGMMGQQPMMGMNQGMMGMGAMGMGMQSPYGQMYAQNPYMQQPMMGGQMGGMMPQAYGYPTMFGR